MDIAKILIENYPGSEWTLEGEEYSGLTWLSDTPKPTKKSLEDSWSQVQAKIGARTQAKIDAKASALAKLAALGLTEEEIAAL